VYICFVAHKYHNKRALCQLCDRKILAFVNTTNLELLICFCCLSQCQYSIVTKIVCQAKEVLFCDFNLHSIACKFRIKSMAQRKTHQTCIVGQSQYTHVWEKVPKSLQQNLFEMRFTEYSGIRQRNIIDRCLYVFIGTSTRL
jgi:hypothetical protein